MTDIAIHVDNLSKLYPARSLAVWRPGVGWAGHLGAVHQRPDTTSADLSAGLRDALTGFLPRTLAPALRSGARAGVTRISRKGKENSQNSRQASQENSLDSLNTCTARRRKCSRQASASRDDIWA